MVFTTSHHLLICCGWMFQVELDVTLSFQISVKCQGSRTLFYVCISPSPPRLLATSETITATQFSFAYQLPQYSPAVVQAKC